MNADAGRLPVDAVVSRPPGNGAGSGEGPSVVTEALEIGSGRELEIRQLAERKAAFHRRHRRAALREWLGALLLVLVFVWLLVLAAVFILSHP